MIQRRKLPSSLLPIGVKHIVNHADSSKGVKREKVLD